MRHRLTSISSDRAVQQCLEHGRFVAPMIEAELVLCNVGRQMPSADTVMRPANPVLYQAEEIFNGVRMYVAFDVDARAVL